MPYYMTWYFEGFSCIWKRKTRLKRFARVLYRSLVLAKVPVYSLYSKIIREQPSIYWKWMSKEETGFFRRSALTIWRNISLSQKFQTTERIIIFITTCINNDYTNAAEAIIVKVLITCFIGIIRLGNIHYINPPVIERAITTFLWPTFFVAKYFLPFHNFAGMKCNESWIMIITKVG